MPDTRHPVIGVLQAGRGIAAIAVLLHHTNTYVTQQVGALPSMLSGVLAFGNLGVDFFFVLSGFIIYHGNRDRIHDGSWASRFARHRFLRIFPPYLLVSLLLAALYLALPALSRGSRDWGLFSTLTLLPSGSEPALSVAWTLQHEIVFYGVALMLFWIGQVRAGMIAWGALILALLPLQLTRTVALAPIDLEFGFGMVAAWLVSSGRVANRVLLPAGLGVLAVFGASSIGSIVNGGVRIWSAVAGLGLALLLVPMVRGELAGRYGVVRPLLFLGNASYAVYLVHQPILSVVVRLSASAGPLVTASLCVAISLVMGILFHLSIERPLLRLCRLR